MTFCLQALKRDDGGVAIGKTDGTVRSGANSMVGRWFYATEDALATVVAAGYFNSARANVKVGDVIIFVAGYGGTLAVETAVFSAVPSSGNVTITREDT